MISHRQSDLFKRLKEMDIKNITGYDKYTPKILDKLYSMGYAVDKNEDRVRWYLKGLLHRVNGPALEMKSGTKHWYINGKHHREDGPAIEYSNGDKVWYLNDKNYNSEQYNAIPMLERISLRPV